MIKSFDSCSAIRINKMKSTLIKLLVVRQQLKKKSQSVDLRPLKIRLGCK